MPHMLIDYTKGLEESAPASDLIDAVFQGSCNSELFNNDFIKIRASSYEDYQHGSGQDKFLHITARILSGRTTEQKKMLSEKILAEVQPLVETVKPISVTVEVVDIEKATLTEYVV